MTLLNVSCRTTPTANRFHLSRISIDSVQYARQQLRDQFMHTTVRTSSSAIIGLLLDSRPETPSCSLGSQGRMRCESAR